MRARGLVIVIRVYAYAHICCVKCNFIIKMSLIKSSLQDLSDGILRSQQRRHIMHHDVTIGQRLVWYFHHPKCNVVHLLRSFSVRLSVDALPLVGRRQAYTRYTHHRMRQLMCNLGRYISVGIYL